MSGDAAVHPVTGQLQADPPVAGATLPLEVVVGKHHMVGPSCQRYNWQTGRCRSIAFGSSPRRGETLI